MNEYPEYRVNSLGAWLRIAEELTKHDFIVDKQSKSGRFWIVIKRKKFCFTYYIGEVWLTLAGAIECKKFRNGYWQKKILGLIAHIWIRPIEQETRLSRMYEEE